MWELDYKESCCCCSVASVVSDSVQPHRQQPTRLLRSWDSPYMTTRKTIALTTWTFAGKVLSLLFNMLSMLAITYLPRRKCLLISWLQSPSAVILDAKNKVWHCFHCFPIYFPWSGGTGCHDLHFWMLSFKPTFSLSTFTFIKRLLSSSSLSAIRVVSSAYLRFIDISPGNLDSSLCFFQSGVSHDVLCI